MALLYLGGFWDFTSDLASKDTAYTSLALPLHTDTTYFNDPAGLQLFHCLSHTASGPAVSSETDPSSSTPSAQSLGGESLLLDGFAAASNLRAKDREAYTTLSSIRIPTHASGNADLSISPSRYPGVGFPVFNHYEKASEPSSRELPETSPGPKSLAQVRWNNDDRATKTDWDSIKGMENWYGAARQWVTMLRNGGLEIEFKLEPGMPLIFDNWRMLHGRRAFRGKRRICGGYSESTRCIDLRSSPISYSFFTSNCFCPTTYLPKLHALPSPNLPSIAHTLDSHLLLKHGSFP